MTTFTLGNLVVISLAASIPFISGIVTSVTTTSGENLDQGTKVTLNVPLAAEAAASHKTLNSGQDQL